MGEHLELYTFSNVLYFRNTISVIVIIQHMAGSSALFSVAQKHRRACRCHAEYMC